MLLSVGDVAALCPSPEGAIATGRERGMTVGQGVRFLVQVVAEGTPSLFNAIERLTCFEIGNKVAYSISSIDMIGSICYD